MSSASGLSAAKRRRAGSNFSLDNNSNDNNVNNGNNGNNNSRLRMQDVVISHEQRIQDIEKIFTDNENIVINNSDNNTEHNDKINTRLDEIENKLVPDVDDKENIAYYKKKNKNDGGTNCRAKKNNGEHTKYCNGYKHVFHGI